MGNVVGPECAAEWRRPMRLGAILVVALCLACASGKPVKVAEATPTSQPSSAPAANAAAAPIEVRVLELAEGAPEAFVNLEASGPLMWTSYRDPEGRVVLELPNAVPGAAIFDLAPTEGLIAAVTVERGDEGDRPLTRFVVSTRHDVEHAVSADGPRLQLRLMPLEDTAVAAAPAAPSLAFEQVPEPAARPSAPEPIAQAGTVEAPATSPARGTAATRVDLVEAAANGEGTVVRIAGDGEFPYSTFLLEEPTRFVIDLPGVVNHSQRTNLPLEGGAVARVRVGQFKSAPEPVVRVVFELSTRLLPRIERTARALVVRFATADGAPARVTRREPEPAAASQTFAERPPAAAPATFSTAANAPAQDPPQQAIEEEDRPAEAVPRGQVEVTRRPQPVEPAVAAEPGLASSGSPADSFASQALGEVERTYIGEPIDLKVTGADINDVIRTFAQLSGLNIIVQPGVTGAVTAEMTNVPWDQALEQILRVNSLGYELDGNVMRIAPIPVLRQEARDRQELLAARALAIPLSTVIKRLSYANAQSVASVLRSGGAGGGLLSQRGNVIVDDRTNTLIIKELPRFLDTVLAVVDNLDSPEPQVMIEARIVETTKRFTRELGIDWGFDAIADAAHGNTTGLVFPNNVTVGGDVGLGVGAPNGLLDVRLGNILNTFTLDIALQAAENEGLINILSAPKVATLNNQAASIQSGLQIPVQTIANNTVTVQFVNATLSLDVTPHVTAEGTILMDIAIRKREPQLGLVIPGATNAPISTKEASTRVIVRDGGTTVIGGIYRVSTDQGEDRVPGLANIPLIGQLFRNRTRRDENEELLIFITPRVIKL